MITESYSAKVKSLLLKHKKKRTRHYEIGERRINCLEKECSFNQKTFRKIAEHYYYKHSSSIFDVLGVRCPLASCAWKCSKSLRCFSEHLKSHEMEGDVNTEFNLIEIRLKKHSLHTAICESMKSDIVLAIKERKKREKAAKVKKLSKTSAGGSKNIHTTDTYKAQLSKLIELRNQILPTYIVEDVVSKPSVDILSNSTSNLSILSTKPHKSEEDNKKIMLKVKFRKRKASSTVYKNIVKKSRSNEL